jgi:hypothetical protein
MTALAICTDFPKVPLTHAQTSRMTASGSSVNATAKTSSTTKNGSKSQSTRRTRRRLPDDLACERGRARAADAVRRLLLPGAEDADIEASCPPFGIAGRR